MKVIVKPMREDKVTAPASAKATAEAIQKLLIQQAQCCVVHLCGCSCNHSGC
jgi:hypothetical protein